MSTKNKIKYINNNSKGATLYVPRIFQNKIPHISTIPKRSTKFHKLPETLRVVVDDVEVESLL